MKRIGFIGLGNMGAPMARNLIRAGHAVTVFDLQRTPVQTLVAEGATAADSALAAARDQEIVISMLPAGKHVHGLYLREAGILQVVADNTLLVDCSTISADEARTVASAAEQQGLTFIDAPVSGGVAGAAAGTLTFICGGPADAVETVRPVLETMGKAVFHAGGSGAGQIAKMCNNMLLGVLMIGTAEALNLADANGLDPALVSEIMKASSGNNWALQVYNPWPGVMETSPASRGYEGGFLTDLIVKDLGLAMDAGLKANVSLPMGSLASALYRAHSASGNGGLDFSSVLRLLRGIDRTN